jgi:hypothetical protein
MGCGCVVGNRTGELEGEGSLHGPQKEGMKDYFEKDFNNQTNQSSPMVYPKIYQPV